MPSEGIEIVRQSRRAGIYYVGAFDDEILRRNQAGFNLDSINETLSQAALFGGELLINDGSLMLSAAGRIALTERSRSPLTALMEAEYVKLYSRNDGDLAAMPVEMQDIVPTYKTLLNSDLWPELEMKLQRLQGTARYSQMYENWPAVNFGPGFQSLINHALPKLRPGGFSDINDNQLAKLSEQFNARMNANPMIAARTTWREVCDDKELGFSEKAKSQLHEVGLEAYHYNLAMTSSLKNKKRQPGVLTRYSRLFTDMRDAKLHQASGSSIERGARLSEIPTPSLSRAVIGRRALHDGRLLAEAVTPGSSLNDAKMLYLDAVDAALSDRKELGAVEAAAKKYAKELARSIGQEEYGKDDKLLVAVKIVAKGATTAWLGHQLFGGGVEGYIVAGAVEHLAEKGAAWVARRFATQSGVFTTPLAVDMLDPLTDFETDEQSLDSEIEGPAWFAFLGIDKQQALSHADTLPKLLPAKNDGEEVV